jgi:regulator of cell morphogenesis and NO signaling
MYSVLKILKICPLIFVMEHDRLGVLLKELRELTKSYEVPNDGCQSFQFLHKELIFFETDTLLHIHKQNNVLFLKLNPMN